MDFPTVKPPLRFDPQRSYTVAMLAPGSVGSELQSEERTSTLSVPAGSGFPRLIAGGTRRLAGTGNLQA